MESHILMTLKMATEDAHTPDVAVQSLSPLAFGVFRAFRGQNG